MIVANARTLGARTTGVQRYAAELLARLGPQVERIDPAVRLHGVLGHVWEQTVLPTRVGSRLLWSPAGTGPLSVPRQVLTVHDMAPFDAPEGFRPHFAAWWRWLVCRLVPRVGRVIADSAFTKERLVNLVAADPDGIDVVALGADARFQECEAAEVDRVRGALGVPSRHYLLSLGSLEPRKNLARLLRVWGDLVSELPDEIWLVVAGSPGSSRVFARAVDGPLPPRVHRTGYVLEADQPALYAGALAFVFPSVYEGFGLPPLEAMASGTPVIASNRSAIPEVVGEAGLLVDPADPEELRSAIERVVWDSALRQRMRETGFSRAKSFRWGTTAQRTLEILEAAS